MSPASGKSPALGLPLRPAKSVTPVHVTAGWKAQTAAGEKGPWHCPPGRGRRHHWEPMGAICRETNSECTQFPARKVLAGQDGKMIKQPLRNPQAVGTRFGSGGYVLAALPRAVSKKGGRLRPPRPPFFVPGGGACARPIDDLAKSQCARNGPCLQRCRSAPWPRAEPARALCGETVEPLSYSMPSQPIRPPGLVEPGALRLSNARVQAARLGARIHRTALQSRPAASQLR